MDKIKISPKKTLMPNLTVNVQYNPREKITLHISVGIFISALIGLIILLKFEINDLKFIVGGILICSFIEILYLGRFKFVEPTRMEFREKGIILTDFTGNSFLIEHKSITTLEITQRIIKIPFTFMTSHQYVSLKIFIRGTRPLLITGICDTSAFSEHQYKYYSIVKYCSKIYQIENSKSLIRFVIMDSIFVITLILFSILVISLLYLI